MSNLFSVKDKVCIVTGGLGQLGRAFTNHLVSEGAKVAVYSRRAVDSAKIEELFPGAGDRVRVLLASVSDKDALEEATAEVTRDWGVPHVLVNNAGIDSKPSGPPEQNGPFETYPQEFWNDVIDVNLTGVMLTTQVVGTRMAGEGRGSIINVGSMYGMVSPNQALYAYREKKDGKPFYKAVAYAASKSGLVNLTRYVATYWAPKNVRCNLITFGGVKTANFDPEFIEAFLQRVPLGRQAEIEEFMGVVQFLASDASTYMTGANTVIDGGFTAW